MKQPSDDTQPKIPGKHEPLAAHPGEGSRHFVVDGSRGNARLAWGWILGAVFLTLSLGALVSAWRSESNFPAAADRGGSRAKPMAVLVVLGQAPELFGREITVEGVVSRTLQPLAITVADRVGAPEELLVVLPRGSAGITAQPGSSVRLAGTLVLFGREQWGSARGAVSPRGLDEWKGRPALLAHPSASRLAE